MWAKLKQKSWEWRGVWITAPTIAGIAIALRLTGWLQPLEWAAFDYYFQLRPPEPVDERILIVGINEKDLQKVGYPFSDAVLAKALLKLKIQQPKAIGLDIYRDLPVEPGHQDLVKVFQTTPNLIGIEKVVGNKQNSAVAASPILQSQDQVGANDVVVDGDSKLRRVMLYLKKDRKIMLSFGLRLALIYLESRGIGMDTAKTNPKYVQFGQIIFPKFAAHDGGYIRADDGGYQILLNYRGRSGSFRTVSLTDVLEDRISPDLVRDRLVIIGYTATSLKDFFNTPYSHSLSEMPEQTAGGEIHANLVSQILSSAIQGRPTIQTWSESSEWLWIFFWSCLGAAASWKLRRVRWIALFSPLAVGGLGGGAYLLFNAGWWIPVVPPALALIGSALAIKSYIAYLDFQERQTLMNLFERHVSPQIAKAIWRDRDQLMKTGHILGRKMTATVLFTDLKGFSTVAEIMEPEDLMSWLNDYMDAMSQVVLAHGGAIDKYIGDAVMAVFGVPIPRTTEAAIAQDAIAAVSCAIAMAARLEFLNQEWQGRGLPKTAMRVGIATGKVVAGSLGCSQRMDYTTIGDSVNVASRLESHNKSLDGGICRIFINEATYSYVRGKFPTKLIGNERVKGREHEVTIYQVLHSGLERINLELKRAK